MYLKFTYFLYYNLNFIFRKLLENNYKKQEQMFYQNHSLALRSYSGDILKFNFKKSLDLDLKNSDYLTGLSLTLRHTRIWLEKKLELPCWTRPNSFYNILEWCPENCPEENWPPVKVRIWFRISDRIKAGSNSPRGQYF